MITAPGPRDLIHSWGYVPNMANIVAALVSKLDLLPAFNVFHFKWLSNKY